MLLTLFDIDQFRSIAWFNVALGVTFIVLQLLLLQGESECKKCDINCVKGNRYKKKLHLDIKWKPVLVSFHYAACMHIQIASYPGLPHPDFYSFEINLDEV